MNRLFPRLLPLLFLALTAVAEAQNPPKEKVRLLIFGNSFSQDSTSHLLALAREGGKNLEFLNLIKGGCSLQEHTAAIKASETDPESAKAKFYKAGGNLADKFAGAKKINPLEGLALGSWDYVSIQQYSKLSFQPESFEPYGKELVDFIRAKIPQAKIIVHETWAYREDSPLFKDGFTQEKMYQALKANYGKLASDYGLMFLPIGDAFQAARKTPEWTFQPDPAFNPATAKPGDKAQDINSLNVGWYWKKPEASATPDISPDNAAAQPKTGGEKLTLDANHANTAGDYLGSCIWYEFLFKDDVTKLTQYAPNGLSAEQAASLRRIAHETMEKQRQASPSLSP